MWRFRASFDTTMPLRYYNSNDEDTERMDRTQSYAQATRPWPAHPQSQSGNGPQSTAPHDPRATQDPPGPLHYAPKGYKAHLATDYVAPRAYATAAPAQQSAQRRPVGPPEHQPLETYRKTEGAKSDPGFLKELKNGVKSMFQTRKEKGSKKKDPPVMPPPANARGAPLNGAPPGGAPARAGPPSQRQQPMAGVHLRRDTTLRWSGAGLLLTTRTTGEGGGGGGAAKTVKRPRQQPAQPPIRQLLGAADTQTAHPATFSTGPAHQPLGPANAATTAAGALAAAAARTQRPDATCEGTNG